MVMCLPRRRSSRAQADRLGEQHRLAAGQHHVAHAEHRLRLRGSSGEIAKMRGDLALDLLDPRETSSTESSSPSGFHEAYGVSQNRQRRVAAAGRERKRLRPRQQAFALEGSEDLGDPHVSLQLSCSRYAIGSTSPASAKPFLPQAGRRRSGRSSSPAGSGS